MWKKLFLSSIIGSIILFLWFPISWMVLPGHKDLMQKFTSPQEVSDVISRYSPKDGIYVLPSYEETEKGTNEPFIFVNIKRGIDPRKMMRPMLIEIFTIFSGVFLTTYLLFQAKPMKYWHRVRFFTIAGIAIAILCAVPKWNWWHFPVAWTFFEIFDFTVGWFLGGLLIAKLIETKKGKKSKR